MLSNDRRAVDFVSSLLGFRDASIGRGFERSGFKRCGMVERALDKSGIQMTWLRRVDGGMLPMCVCGVGGGG